MFPIEHNIAALGYVVDSFLTEFSPFPAMLCICTKALKLFGTNLPIWQVTA